MFSTIQKHSSAAILIAITHAIHATCISVTVGILWAKWYTTMKCNFLCQTILVITDQKKKTRK